MKILDLNIDFPDIDGTSTRQIWYADKLRSLYVKQNYDRFAEIAETVTFELDHRDIDYNDELLPTFEMDFNNQERTCLFAVNAGGIIANLKNYVHWTVA